MGRVKDLTGMKFGRLTVIERRGSDKKKRIALWLCKCDCGNEIIVRGDSLRNGHTKSCGCYVSDKMREMWKDEEFKQMQSNKAKEQWKDEEFKQMQIDRIKEQWKDEEFKQMQSNRAKEQMKEMWKDKEFNDKMREMWKDEEFKQMQSNKAKEQWKDEEMKWKMGYKGGITLISDHLRRLPVVKQWLYDCKKQVNYTCELTGKVGGELNTHHLKAFNTIVLEAHELHNIEIHKIVGEYSQDELHKLEEYVVSWHKDNSNAVVLRDEVHKLFHDLYGKGNNTKEQYIEFKERYLNGEFDDLLGDDLND